MSALVQSKWMSFWTPILFSLGISFLLSGCFVKKSSSPVPSSPPSSSKASLGKEMKSSPSRANPSKSTASSNQDKELVRIAVLMLNNKWRQKISVDEVNYLTSTIRIMMSYLPKSEYLVMTKESMEVLIDPSKGSLEECVGKCEVETGRLLGASWIVTGEILKFGSQLSVVLKVHNTETGQFAGGGSFKGKSVDGLELPLKKNVLKLMKAVSPKFIQALKERAGSSLTAQVKLLEETEGDFMGEQKRFVKVAPSGPSFADRLGKIKPSSSGGSSKKLSFEEEIALMKQQKAEKEAHQRQVDSEWRSIRSLSGSAEERLRKIDGFVSRYQRHPLGNPREVDALQLRKQLEGQMARDREDRLKGEHERRVRLKWNQVESLVRVGDERGEQALRLFLAEYERHPFGNPLALEARNTFEEGKQNRMENHRTEVKRAWKEVLSLAEDGGDSGIRAVELFLRRFDGHMLGNHLESDARQALADLRAGRSIGGIIRIKGIEFVQIPGGSFMMGSEEGDSDEKPVHEVRLEEFYMSKTEVTVAQYRQCVDAGMCSTSGLTKYSSCNWNKSDHANHPITCVDWNQARTFAKWTGGDLPSEAQWEFSARGGKGNQFKYAGSNNLDDVGWYDYNSGRSTHPVGKKKVNGYSLYDMSGNVWEWVLDEKESYSNTPRDGSAQCSNSECTGSSLRVYRGGSWSYDASLARVTYRSRRRPSYRDFDLGFRVVRSK